MLAAVAACSSPRGDALPQGDASTDVSPVDVQDDSVDASQVSDLPVVADAPAAPDGPVLPDVPALPDVPMVADVPTMSCPMGLTACGAACVDTRSDARACGGCTTACATGQVCAAGVCQGRVSTLVLSELRAQPTAYLELYNGSGAAVSLSGYQIQWAVDSGANGSFALPTYSLAAGAFVVLTAGTGTPPADTLYVTPMPVWSSQIAVRLLSPTGSNHDFVRTGMSTVAPPAGSMWLGDNAPNPSRDVNQSLVRNVFRADTDSAADWSLQALSSPAAACARGGVCGAACVDLDNDRANCGACGVTCRSAEYCRGGACVAGAGSLWISEYRRSPRAFVEIHNPSATPVSIRNYRLEVRSGGRTTLNYFMPDRVLAPGGYLAVFEGVGSDDASAVFTGMSGNFVAGASLSLYNTGTTVLDFVPFGAAATTPPTGGAWFGPAVAEADGEANASARRNLAASDTDMAADWTASVSPATPGYACAARLIACGARCVDTDIDPSHCGGCGRACAPSQTCVRGACRGTGQVLLSKLRNVGAEMFELHNGTLTTQNVGGWTVTWVADGGSDSFTIPAGTMIPSNGYLQVVEGAGSSTTTRLYMGRQVAWSSFISVGLTNGGAGVDFVRTASSPTTPPTGTSWTGAGATNPSDTVDESLVRDVFVADTNSAAEWHVIPSAPADGPCVGRDVCGGACVATLVDADNCGACGNACGVGNTCSNGRCFEGPRTMRDGDARLVSGTSSDNGILEVYYSGAWRPVCDDGLTGVAQVVCRQLGYGGGTASCCATGGSSFLLDDVSCSGSEPNLLACSHAALYTHNCTAGENIRVACTR